MADTLATSRVALRDRPFVDVLDLSFRFVRESFGSLWRIALVMLPLPILATIAIGKSSGGWWLAWTFALFFAGLVSAPFTVLVSQFVFSENPSVRVALAQGLRALPRLFFMRIVLAFAFGLGTLLMFMPVIWVATACFFVQETMLLERATVYGTFSRSSRLGSSAGGDALMGSMIAGLIYFVAPMLVHEIGGIVLEHVFSVALSHELLTDGGSVLAVIGFWLAVPYVALLRFLFYINVRTRAEGWDIQTAFATIAARPEEEVAA